jgi:hypothetical protein
MTMYYFSLPLINITNPNWLLTYDLKRLERQHAALIS